VARALDWLLAAPAWRGVPYRPKALIFAGFAGALDPALRVGDVLLADEVVDGAGGRWPTTWPGVLPESHWEPPLHRGRLLSTPQLIATPDEKAHLAKTHQAWAVDMESAVFAERCTGAGVPFGCLRAVSDDAATSLSPALVHLLSAGRVAPLRLVSAVARRPSLVPELMRLGRDTRHAARQLAAALGELLTLTLPWFDE
jgi:adenosylhomocysteine nucleosidase